MNARICDNPKIASITIAGQDYPLNFSIKAAKRIIARFEDIDNVLATLADMPVNEQFDAIIWILQILLEQGVAYMRVFEGEEIRVFSVEDLEVVFHVTDIETLYTALAQTMSAGRIQEVEVEMKDMQEKNRIATPE